jgi:hypothetical protein
MTILDIEEDLNRLKEDLDGSNKKYYHLKSITNFLYHFHSLEDKNSKEEVLILLTNLFNYYKEHSIRDIQESLTVFQKYLKPIGEIYEQQLGFFVFIAPWLLFLYIMIGYGVVFLLLNNNFIAVTIFLLVVIIILFYLGIKYYQRKLYSFLW